MAVAVTGINTASPPHHGYAVVGENTVNYYQSRSMASGIVSSTVLHRPALADYVDDIRTTSFTGIRKYTGDTDQ